MRQTSSLSAYLLVISALPLMLFGFVRNASAREPHAPTARAQAQGGGPIVVNSLADNASANDAACTLREAIENANTNLDSTDGDCVVGQAAELDTVTFSISGTITLGSALPAITGTLAISGGNSITLSGNSAVTVLTVEAGAALTLSELTIADGQSTSGEWGGAISSEGALTVTNVLFTENGSSYHGGAILNRGTLYVSDSRFISNTSTSYGGAIYSDRDSVRIEGSTFTGNEADPYGGAIAIQAGAPISISDSSYISTSSFISNTALYGGGAIRYVTNSGTLLIANSTFGFNRTVVTNTPSNGGGAIEAYGHITIINSTFHGNMATNGPDIRKPGITRVAVLRNTIIDSGCVGTFIDGGHNIEAGTSCGFSGINNSRNNTDARLLPLADNGGPTPTFALSVTSPAINAGEDALCLATDQRGQARPIGPRCDIGAYELSYTPAAGQSALVVNSLLDTDDGTCDLPGQGVGNQGCTLREAIGLANNVITTSDTITFVVSGTILLGAPLPQITGTLAISAGNAITVSGAQSYSVFNVPANADLWLDQLTIVNGHGVDGGGIQNRGTLTITKGLFTGNRALIQGGAIVNYGALTVTETRFVSNTSDYVGGAIYSEDGPLAVGHSEFISNTTLGNGGALAILTAQTATIDASTFISNTSLFERGGAISNYSISGTLYVVSSTFTGNLAPDPNTGKGGGLFNGAGHTIVLSSTFSDNASSIGGAIYNDFNSDLGVSATTFTSNTALVSGGAIANLSASELRVEDSGFSGNSTISTTSGGGGALDNQASAWLTVNRTSFIANTSTAGGAVRSSGALSVSYTQFEANTGAALSNLDGSLYVMGSVFSANAESAIFSQGALTVEGSLFLDNQSGAIVKRLPGALAISTSTFISNSGGALVNEGSSTAAIDRSTFKENAGSGGAGVRNVSGPLVVSASDFVDNRGGALYNLTFNSVSITNSLFAGNIITGNGAAIYNAASSPMSISGTLFMSNSASASGAGVYNSIGSTFTLTAGTFISNSANSGGAMFNGGTLSVTNSTLGANSVISGSGALHNTGALGVLNSTFAANGIGIYSVGGGSMVWNSIVADGCHGTIGDGGYNIDAGASCAFSSINRSRSNLDPALMPWASDSRLIATYALSITSPAINSASDALCPATDQRGLARPIGPRCDIGAYELLYTPAPGSATLNVNTLVDTDDGNCDLPGQGVGNQGCSLREAISMANVITSSDTITFDVSGTIALGAPLPAITGTLSILAGSQAVTISGSSAHRVFDVPAGAALWLDLVTVANGYSISGGAVRNFGVLTLTNALFTGNTAIAHGGAALNFGVLVVSHTRFVSNTSGFEGGAIYSEYGALAVGRSVFISNTAAGNGGALEVRTAQTVTIDASTFVSNTSLGWRGGAIHNNGISGTLRVLNSTFAGNRAPGVDYGAGGGLFNSAGRVDVINSTFSGNASPFGSAVAQITETATVTTTAVNSIVADGCAGAIRDGGHNIDGGTSCGFSDAAFSRSAIDARLLPLADNGGPTPTFALSETSPAINMADSALCPLDDQRGAPRTYGDRCDIGAFELSYGLPDISTTLTVNQLGDSDDGYCDAAGAGFGNQGCTLREAIGQANFIPFDDVIRFGVSGTVTLTAALPDITGTLAILGNANPITVNGAHSFTVFSVSTGAALALDAVTIAHGRGVGFAGGGVDNAGTLTVTNALFIDNNAGHGGAISSILSANTSVSNSRFISNSAGYGGGAIFSDRGLGVLTVVGSTFIANHAGVTGGAIELNSSGQALIETSAFLSNTALTQGGAVNSYPISGSLQVDNSTFAFNRVLTPTTYKAAGGGIESWRPLTVTNSTFHRNASGITATNGIATMTSTLTLLRNSIVDDGCAGGGVIIDNGNNLDRGTSCGFSLANNSYSNTDARLLPPAENGGPTPSMALSDTSPAINMGEREFCTGADQRGMARPFGAYCDIGAVETSYVAPPVVSLLQISSLDDSDDGFCDMPNIGFGNHGCTLREAIRVANILTGANSASFIVSGTITLRAPTPPISDALTLLGAGSSITVSGANTFTVFRVDPGAALAIDGITITQGYSWLYGGGIENYGALTVTRSAFFENRSNGLGGAIANLGSATIDESRFTGNTAMGRGGAILSANGPITITRSTFGNNAADIGGALDIHTAGHTSIGASSFISNIAGTLGGAINSQPTFGSVTIVNSTFGFNRVLSTGLSMAGGGAIAADGIMTVTNSTLHANTASNGPDVLALHPMADIVLQNSVVDDGCAGGITDGGHNIDHGSTCGFFAVLGSLSNTDARLMPLIDDNLALVFPLTVTSPAVNAGNNASCPAFDQRGLPRLVVSHCDVGAYELSYVPPVELSELVVNVLADSDDGYCSAAGVGIGNQGCSLREAMIRAPGYGAGATITLAVTGTIPLGIPLPDITGTLSLLGAGQPVTVSGSNRFPVLTVANGAALRLDAITIADGYDWQLGGGVKNDGTLTVTYATFTHNRSPESGMGGGAIVNRGMATIRDSRFISNSAGYRGGAILALSGQLRIERVSLIDNYSVGSGGAVEVISPLTTTIGNSAFISNTAGWGSGGAIANGALSVTLEISNSVFGYNRAPLNSGGAIYSFAPYTVTNGTFHGNNAGISGADVYQNGPALTIRNSIVGGSCGRSSEGVINDGGHNIDGGNSCGFDSLNGSKNNTDARLQPLAYYGPLSLIELRNDSPAINAGNNSTCASVDMRGWPRPYGIRCDIGAVELAYEPPAPNTLLTVNVLGDGDDGYCSAPGTGVGNQGCTLREAINKAATLGASATIPIAVTGTIALDAPLPDITGTLSLLGVGQPVTVSGSNRFTVLTVANGAALTLDALTIADGYSSQQGGGIQNDGTLTVTHATFTHNRAVAGGRGGAILNRGAAAISNSRFISNTAGYRGGAIFADAGRLHIARSTFVDNYVSGSGGALDVVSSAVTIDSSAFLSNTAEQGGGGAVSHSGMSSTLVITNSVFGHNQAPLRSGGAIAGYAPYTVTNSTFHGNSAGQGGADLYQKVPAATLQNSIINSGCLADSAGAIIDGGHNIDRGSGCGFSMANFSINNIDARLLPLRDVEGGVPGFPLDVNSPAINAGNNATCPAVDLRGAARPIDLRCEIGALEFDYMAGSYGATFVVNTLADSDDASCDFPGQGVGNQDCSLREAIFLSNLLTDTNAISFSVDGTITLGALLPQITSTLEILGAGRAITLSGAVQFQVLSVLPGASLTIDGITIADGGNASSQVPEGGAIYNQGTLTVRTARFLNNQADINGGAIMNFGNASIANSQFVSNGAGYAGGAIFSSGDTLTVKSSIFRDNSARSFGGAVFVNNGVASQIDGSAFISNTTLFNSGGAIATANLVTGTTSIVNSTFADNRAKASNNLAGGVVNLNGNVVIINSTFADNGLALHTVEPTIDRSMFATTTVINTIIARGGCAGVIVDGGRNLDDGSSCGFVEVGLSRSNLDAKLGPLGDYGGDTLTLLPAADSPALGMANDALCPPIDQRGVSRPQGHRCDIGAVEQFDTAPTPTPTPTPVETLTPTPASTPTKTPTPAGTPLANPNHKVHLPLVVR